MRAGRSAAGPPPRADPWGHPENDGSFGEVGGGGVKHAGLKGGWERSHRAGAGAAGGRALHVPHAGCSRSAAPPPSKGRRGGGLPFQRPLPVFPKAN